MAKRDKEDGMSDANAEYPTIIGADASFKGELTFDKGVRLLGKFDGQIETKGNLLVAEGARLSGEVKACNAQIDGEMVGNLNANGKVLLSATASLEGDLETARLEVADGATFVGRVIVGAKGAKTGTTPGSSPPAVAATAARSPEKSKAGQNQPAMAGKN